MQPLTQQTFNQELLDFLSQSPTPFHAVQQMKAQLIQAGFVELYETEKWPENIQGKFFVTRNHSSIIAFKLVHSQSVIDKGLRVIGAHTDSPCLKVKPIPDLHQHQAFQLGVEVYGGALLHPWFDRDLSIAGRVVTIDQASNLTDTLIDFKKAIATIPSLAIHLNRDANKNSIINRQTDINPVLIQAQNTAYPTLESLIRTHLEEQHGQTFDQLLDYDLYFYDTQAPALLGMDDAFIVSARLDNLLSCYTGLKSLLSAQEELPSLLVCHDHEEVGSQSFHGAQGNFVRDVLNRLLQSADQYSQAMAKSFMISVDNAHALHPNFPNKHDAQHGPILNAGPVIKTNSNQRYATNSLTSSLIKYLSVKTKQPIQQFVVRNDMGCGSTIGPMSASHLGVRSVDIGVPQWAMHSIRETAGAEDAFSLYHLLTAFYELDDINALIR